MTNRRTTAAMVRVLDDADATPGDICEARDWGAIPAASARAWLVGYYAGKRAAPPAPARATLSDEAREGLAES